MVVESKHVFMAIIDGVLRYTSEIIDFSHDNTFVESFE